MIRVVLGRLDNGATLAVTGSRVMLLGGSLLVDGKRVAYKNTLRPIWLDEHGRAWDTVDFHEQPVRERTAEDLAAEEARLP